MLVSESCVYNYRSFDITKITRNASNAFDTAWVLNGKYSRAHYIPHGYIE